jgi:ATP-binding cassette, subfamily B, multidrug efflux pump
MSAAQVHEDEALGKAYDSRLMRRLLTYVRPYKSIVLSATAVLLVGSFLQISLTFLTQIGIDEYITKGKADGFGLIALAFLGVAILRLVLSYGENFLTALLGQKVQHDIRMQIFRKMQSLPLSYYDKNPVGRMLTRVTNDVNVLNEMFSAGVVTIIGDLVMLVLIVGALLYYSWQLALVTFMVLPLLIIATILFRKKVRETYREIRIKLARLNAFMQEHLTGITLVQLFRQEKRTHDRFDDINQSLRNSNFRSIYYYAVFFPAAEIIGALSIGLLLYYGGGRIYDNQLTFGELVAFIHLVERFYGPIRDLAEKYNVLQSAMASSERVFELLDTPSGAEPQLISAQQQDKFRGKIELENVWFAYNGDNWVLRDVSFTVEPGQKVAIVGATGAGKSSLISLLYRFYDYQKGTIKLDGVDLKSLTTERLRSHFALVLQDVYLFSGDIASNVRLRRPDISDKEVTDSLTRVGFDRFLRDMPDGVKTLVKERGATLSTGQKQLLSFARALAFNPEILILDEATSSVDSETETLIQKALDTLLEKRTAIVIAHRLSTIEKADKIVVLHHGQVREIGTHAELIGKKGIYHTLYLMQYRKQTPLRSVTESIAG